MSRKLRAAEQICRGDRSPGYRKFLKRRLRRAERRIARLSPEDAPMRHYYRGYSL